MRLDLSDVQKSMFGEILIPSGDQHFYDKNQTTPITAFFPSPIPNDVLIATYQQFNGASGLALIGFNTVTPISSGNFSASGMYYGTNTIVNPNKISGFDITEVEPRII